MPELQELREQRKTLYEDLRDLVTKGDAALKGDEGTDDYVAVLDAKRAKFANLTKRIETLEEIEAARRKDAGYLRQLPQEGNPGTAENTGASSEDVPAEYRKAFLFNTMRAILNKDRDALQAMKTLQSTNSALGGWYLPESMAEEIIGPLKEELVFNKLRTSIRPLIDGKYTIRKRGTRPSTYWLGENNAITASDYTGGRLELVAKYIAALIQVSNRLLNSSQGGVIEADIRRELTEELLLGMEDGLLYGVGGVPAGTGHSGAQPTGLTLYSGIQTFQRGADADGTTNASANGGLVQYVDIVRAVNMLDRSNVPERGTRGWITNPIMRAQLQEVLDGENRPLLNKEIIDGVRRDTLAGYPVVYSTMVPVNLTKGGSSDCTHMILGEWRHFNIGLAQELQIAVNTESDTAFQQYETHFRGIMGVDCIPSYPEAFVILANLTTGL